jgi:hypothetical protein
LNVPGQVEALRESAAIVLPRSLVLELLHPDAEHRR